MSPTSVCQDDRGARTCLHHIPTPPSPVLERAATDSHRILQRSIGNVHTATHLIGRTNEQDSPLRDVIASPSVFPDHESRTQRERHLNADRSDVHPHLHANATGSMQATAHTFAAMSSIIRFSPGTAATDQTLPHELTHVAPPGHGAADETSRPGVVSMSNPDNRFERAAERSARALSSRSLKPRGEING